MISLIKKCVAPFMGLNPADFCSVAKLQAMLLTLTLMVAALGVSSAVAAEKKMVKDPATGEMVTEPEYGGTLTYVRKQVGEHTDVYLIRGAFPFSGSYISLSESL